MPRLNCHVISRIALLSTSLLMACDAVQLCGQYVCVTYEDECERTRSCSEPRQCEGAGSIRDRAPSIINQLREANRSCRISSGIANGNTNTGEVDWDDTLARVANSHARDMARNRFESFVGSNGLSTSERVSMAGIESLLVSESVTSGPQTTAEAINIWLDTNTDCRQLIASDITRIGMACATDNFGNSGPYWSLLLVGPEP